MSDFFTPERDPEPLSGRRRGEPERIILAFIETGDKRRNLAGSYAKKTQSIRTFLGSEKGKQYADKVGISQVTTDKGTTAQLYRKDI